MLVAMAGLPGTGKSRLARALAAALGGVVLDKDHIRAALFPQNEIEYSTAQDDFCVSIMLQVADYLFRKNPRRLVILDGRPFALRYQRAEVARFAEARGIALRFVECVCADDTARRRLARGAAHSARRDHQESTRYPRTAGIPGNRHPARNRDYALYQQLQARFEPIEEPKLLVDTDQQFAKCLADCLAYVRAEMAATAGPPEPGAPGGPGQ